MSLANFMGLEQKENNSIWGLLIHCFLKINPNNTFLSASYSMIFVGHIMPLFICMLIFLIKLHTGGEKNAREREKKFIPNVHLCVCQQRMLVLAFIYVCDTTL